MTTSSAALTIQKRFIHTAEQDQMFKTLGTIRPDSQLGRRSSSHIPNEKFLTDKTMQKNQDFTAQYQRLIAIKNRSG